MTRKQKLFLDYYHSKGCSQQAAEEALAKFYSINTWSKKKRKEYLDKILHNEDSELYLEGLNNNEKKLEKGEKLEKNIPPLEERSKSDENLEKNKGGRPKKVFSKEEWKMLKECVRILCTKDEICKILDIDQKTLTKVIKGAGYEDGFSQYYKKYSCEGKMSLRRKQFEVATNGSVPMLIWLGKQHLGQRDKTESENTNIHGGGINITRKIVDPKKKD